MPARVSIPSAMHSLIRTMASTCLLQCLSNEYLSISPTINPIDGQRFPAPLFQVWWDWLERHDGYWEMIITVADTGFAYLIFVPDADNTEPKLRHLCRTYAEPAGAVL